MHNRRFYYEEIINIPVELFEEAITKEKENQYLH